MDQLRRIHDRMVFEIEKKEQAIKELQAKVQDKELIDRKNIAELREAEVRCDKFACGELVHYHSYCPTCIPVIDKTNILMFVT